MSTGMNNVTEFLSVLVKWGGVQSVDDEHFIVDNDGERVTVNINGKVKAMRIPFEDMRQDVENKSTIFLPLNETVGHTAERRWFFESRTKLVGEIVQECMKRILEICAATEETEPTYDQLSLAQVYNDRADLKMITELEKINSLKLLRIIYNKRKCTVQLHSDIMDDDYIYGKLKLRKKTGKLLRDMFGDIMSTEDVKKDYLYQSVEMGMQQIECFINMLHMYSRSVGNYAFTLLGVSLFATELEDHIENLSAYRKSCRHLVSATIQGDKVSKDTANKPVSTTTTSTIPGAGGIRIGGGLPSPQHIPVGSSSGGVPQGTLAYAQIAARAAVDPMFSSRRFLGEPGITIGSVGYGAGTVPPGQVVIGGGTNLSTTSRFDAMPKMG